MKKIINILIVSGFITSCGFYSFTGASIPEEAKSVSVNYFTTTATNAPSSLSQTVTEELRDLLLSQTSLELTELEGDLIFKGKITKYNVSPMAIQANETAGKNRLSIAIKATYINNFNNKQNFENIFSRYRDFNSSENLADIENILIEGIINEILEDIFNKAFVNW